MKRHVWQVCDHPLLAHADHKTILQLESDVDMLMARLAAQKPLEESTALLADVAVRAHGQAAAASCSACPAWKHPRCLASEQRSGAVMSIRDLSAGASMRCPPCD